MKPLLNRTVLITRPEAADPKLKRLLEKEGAKTISLPTFELHPIPPSRELLDALRLGQPYGWILLPSTNAARFLKSIIQKENLTLHPSLKIATVGASTASWIEDHLERTVEFCPSMFTARQLINEFPESNAQIMVLTSSITRTDFKAFFAAKNKTADIFHLYENRPARFDTKELSKVMNLHFDFVTFASSSAAEGLAQLKGSERTRVNAARIVCIGPETKATAQSLGFEVAAVADPHHLNGMVEAMKHLLNDGK